MSTNAELAKIFEQMSEVLELTEANPFRVNAHAKVARVLENLTTDVATLADDPKQLTAIDGIGKGSAEKIVEYVNTGKVSEHEELLDQVPVGLLAVMQIPGLGPKTVKLLWDKADVTDLESLKKALDTGELEQLPRMGAKTIQNIRDSLDFAEKSTRIRLGEALPVAESIVAALREADPDARVEYAGSLRRGRETIGDIDILAATSHPATLSDAFRSMPEVAKVIASGETKSSVRLLSGIQVDLRVVDADAFGAALMYFTGSKDHNVRLRERAIKKKLRLNEYGLFRETKSGEPESVAGKAEEDVYKALGLPWIPPELREDRGEIARKPPADLIQLTDIKAELHAHTTASDGRLTIDELAHESFRGRGFHTIAVTDHSKASAQANGLDETRLMKHIDAVREADARLKGITILAGAEVDILGDGSLDYDDETLAQLDIVVASPHVALRQDAKKATDRLLRAIRHPLVHILGHPTGRLINRRDGLHPDINALVAAAAEHDTALEINAHYYRLDLRDTHVRAAVDAGALLAIDTDAHSRSDFDNLRYGILTARRGWLPSGSCINTWPKKKLHDWLKRKR